MATYSSLTEFISQGKLNSISYQNLAFVQPFNDIKFPMYNVIQDYIKELKQESTTITFTDNEYDTYKYKPRLLAGYVYGSTEFFFIILALNDIATEKEFTMKTIKLLSADKMKELLEKINSLEKQSIQSYNSRMMDAYMSEKESE